MSDKIKLSISQWEFFRHTIKRILDVNPDLRDNTIGELDENLDEIVEVEPSRKEIEIQALRDKLKQSKGD